MNLERLAYIVLKVIVKSERKQGQIRSILKQQGIGLSDLDAREVGRFIESKKLGTIIHIPLGEVLVMSNLNAENFVNQLSNMTFEQKLKLIYSELETLPDKKGKLEDILDNLGIDHDPHTEREFLDSFKETGNVHITATTKDGSIIVLTQKGHDNLHAPSEKPVQPQIVIEKYKNSNVNKGGIQSGIFQVGGDFPNNLSNITPNTNDAKQANKSRNWFVDNIINIIIGILTAIILYYTIVMANK